MPEPAPARPAASLILMRRGGRHSSSGLEVMMGRRSPEASFMPGIWVFPGGAVEDGEELHRAALRELAEEVGIELALETELVAWARWITPEEIPVRFDTYFFAAMAPAHASPTPDGREIVDARWLEPRWALECAGSGELSIVFPTVRQLEGIAEFETPDELLETARRRGEPPAILPRIVGEGDERRVALPGEPGYERG